MQLMIVKENYVNEYKKEDVDFQFFKNIIKKDLELVSWCNSAVKVFGEFQVFSDHRSELNSFDQIVIFITKNFNVFDDDTVESTISNLCTDYFFNTLTNKDCKLTSQELDSLADTTAKFIIESTLFVNNGENRNKEVIKTLARKFFIA